MIGQTRKINTDKDNLYIICILYKCIYLYIICMYDGNFISNTTRTKIF